MTITTTLKIKNRSKAYNINTLRSRHGQNILNTVCYNGYMY